jgi:transcriptional regulator with XRE-family HTH domain
MCSKSETLIKFGQNVRLAREAKGFSQEFLAVKAGLDRTYVGGVERGERNISLLNICRLASALDITPSTLMDGVSLDEKGKTFHE